MTQEEKLCSEIKQWLEDKKSYEEFGVAANQTVVLSIEDYLLSKLAEHHREWVESVRKEVNIFKKELDDRMNREVIEGKFNPNDSFTNGVHLARSKAFDDILSLPSLSLTNSKVCGALIHTRGLDGKGLYCAAEKPCKLHSKSK